ncbi:MAG: ATP-binding protein [Desulfuromonadales bacterium]|nr:ATP-binding protein [Desulfuromonadales bacterium]
MPSDRSSQKQETAEQSLYALVLDNIDRAVIAVDQHGRINLFNPAAETFMGCSDGRALGQSYRELFAGQQRFIELFATVLSEGRAITDDDGFTLLRPLAAPLPVNAHLSPIFSRQGVQQGAVMILRDLTRSRELEEALRRADRLALLATLAAGLAHEIKNPLGGIKGAAQLLAGELAAEDSLTDYPRVMIREVERINGIIEELLDLGAPLPTAFGDVNLTRILNDIVLLQQQASAEQRIRFRMQFDPSIPPIEGDEQLLIRLFLNLIKNAREAIDGSGKVTIETKISSEYHLSVPGQRPSPMVVVRISDSGCGIEAAHLDTIFTPYYTTKPSGTGLGLAICQKVVEDHRGFFQIDSIPGNGTTVTISLPLRQNRGNGWPAAHPDRLSGA